MQFPDEVSDEVLDRLRRAEGQLRGVERLIEEGADCKKVLTQLNAAQAALNRAGLRLVAAGMRFCLADPERAEAEGMPDEMERLFLVLRDQRPTRGTSTSAAPLLGTSRGPSALASGRPGASTGGRGNTDRGPRRRHRRDADREPAAARAG